jgi:putative ABC transport system permease protein
MFKHYLTTALRHFRQHKLTTGINVACLALGLACFMFAWSVVAYFGQMDRYHTRASRTYLVAPAGVGLGASAAPTQVRSPWALADHLATDFPKIESVARLTGGQQTQVEANGAKSTIAVAYTEPKFLQIFDLPFRSGNPTSALNDPRSAVVSVALAQKLFGSDAVVGRTLRLDNRETVTITGVIDSIPQPSHLSTEQSAMGLGVSFDALVSMDVHVALLTATARDQANQAFNRWSANWYVTYVVLPKDGSLTLAQVNSGFEQFSQRHVPDEDGKRAYQLKPISDFTTISLNAPASATGLTITTILKLLGSLVLLVACANYANLASAQAATRAKEVALRKVVGASRRQVTVQYLFEAILLTASALLLAFLLIATLALSAGAATLAGLASLFFRMPAFWIVIASVLGVVTVLAGSYPALVLARVRPVVALRDARSKGGASIASSLLVGLQFGFTSFLMIAVFVMVNQYNASKRAVWDPAQDPMVVIANNTAAAGVDRQLLKAELLRKPGIVAVSGIERMPWGLGGMGKELTTSADTTTTQVRPFQNIVDLDFFTALNIRLLAGRTFERSRADDLTEFSVWQRTSRETADGSMDFNAIVDRSLARSLGFSNPNDAVGRKVYHPISLTGSAPPQRLHIIGVVEDALLRPLSGGVNTNFYLLSPDAAVNTVVRISKRDVAQGLASIDSVWKTLAPNEPIKRRFADEQFETTHRILNVINDTVGALAIFASVIALMGLIGMALHIIRRRTHEIGVRKTLGASVGQILWLLLRSFSKPIVIANLAVWPLVYVAMHGYLSLFAVSSAMTLTPFIASLVITLLIAWAAVALQATKAARMNPASVLRNE